jgi:hypothetical protein
MLSDPAPEFALAFFDVAEIARAAQIPTGKSFPVVQGSIAASPAAEQESEEVGGVFP